MHTMQSVLQLVIRRRKQAFHSSRVCAFCFSSKLFQPARLSSLARDLLCIMCPHLCLLGRRKKTSLPTCGGIFSLRMRSSARWLEPDDRYEGKDQINNLMSNLLHHFPINNFDLLITLLVSQKLCIIAYLILIIPQWYVWLQSDAFLKTAAGRDLCGWESRRSVCFQQPEIYNILENLFQFSKAEMAEYVLCFRLYFGRSWPRFFNTSLFILAAAWNTHLAQIDQSRLPINYWRQLCHPCQKCLMKFHF